MGLFPFFIGGYFVFIQPACDIFAKVGAQLIQDKMITILRKLPKVSEIEKDFLESDGKIVPPTEVAPQKYGDAMGLGGFTFGMLSGTWLVLFWIVFYKKQIQDHELNPQTQMRDA